MPAIFTSETTQSESVSGSPTLHDASGLLQVTDGLGHDEEGNQIYGNIDVNSSDVRWGHWGLRKGFNLRKAAADFYLLYDLYIDEDDDGAFQPMFQWLLNQFISYTDMAVGGELRHAKGKVSHDYIPVPLKRAMRDGTLPIDRHKAWKGWRFFRMNYGLKALEWAVEVFPRFSGGGYGGPRWAKIAAVLQQYEAGELTPIIFVDTCWGLQHNGGIYFNKAWATHGLEDVLNANQRSDIGMLRAMASPIYRDLHIAQRGQ
jgi:hypothetical protein